MKKLPKYLTIIVTSMMVWGAFLVSEVKAVTFYQQLSDSASALQIKDFTPNESTLVGSFAVTQTVNLSGGRGLAVIRVEGGTPISVNVIISSTTPPYTPGDPFDGGYTIACAGCAVGVDSFEDMAGGSGILYPGIVYYVYMSLNGNNNDEYVVTNLSGDFFYGYMTDGDGESIPIAPGIPGFTDVGISTTSQQTYCNANFSTTTGLLDNIGASFARGICNVTVFLFIPSSNAVAQWQGLASTSSNKIPFSYFTDLRTLFNNLSATTSETVPTYAANMAAVGIGSTTPIGNILPSLTWLSVSAIQTYLPAGIHDALFFLARCAIWFSVAMMFYRRVIPHKAKV